MDLKEFIRETLLQIVGGVEEAQNDARRGRAIFNPHLKMKIEPSQPGSADTTLRTDLENLKGSGLLAMGGDGVADIIEFDVAVTVEGENTKDTGKKEGGSAGAKLHIFSASIDASTAKASKERNARSDVTRVKFRVPVMLPRPK
jgi:hypothetical protein